MKVFSSIPDLNIDSDHPYLTTSMFKHWETSGVTKLENGWEPVYFQENDSFSYAYKKAHSYGEYIFDWAWADLFHRFGVPYYPKLLHALPVTPITAPKFINASEDFLQNIVDYYQKEDFSSHHILFCDEMPFFGDRGYLYQKTLQFHFINNFETFDDFLASLKARKRKNILKERKTIDAYPIEIKKVQANNLDHRERKQIYSLYLTTIMKKYSQAYLTEDFFLKLERGFYFLAFENERLIAMSLFFEGGQKLYGRYWGIDSISEQKYPFLHFEMCYYLGIEHTILKKYQVFEAGAQGEQKLLRGFTPVEIGSLHHIKHPQFRQAIESHLIQQNLAYEQEIENLKEYLPFKKKGEPKTLP